MAALGWLGCAAVLVAWAGTAAWDRLTRTEVLAVFEDAETEPVTDAPTPLYDQVAEEEAHRIALVEMRLETLRPVSDAEIERLLSGTWSTEDGAA